MTWLSIIMPTYNRAATIRRAIDSCLSQAFTDFEIVVIDSASNDGTPDIVRTYADARVRLVEESTRRGVCPARNLGVDNARGSWMVILDSDDEMAPGAMDVIATLARESGPNIGMLRFCCRWDDGSISPDPPLKDEVWDYRDYLRFRERTAGRNGETLPVIRGDTFERVRFAENRAYETLYHLEFAKLYDTRTTAAVGRLYHTDSANQNSFTPNPKHWLRVAPDQAESMVQVIERHGEALRESAPKTYVEELRSAGKFLFLAGDRVRGARYTLRALRRRPFSPIAWATLIFGCIGRHGLAWADAVKFAVRRWSLSTAGSGDVS